MVSWSPRDWNTICENIRSARVRRKFPFMDTASFTLAPNLIISLSIWFWSIAIQAFHWLRQILLCQSSRLGQLKITHSFEVNLNIFIKNKFFNCFFLENNHIWRKVKEKGSSPKLISPFLDPICRLRSLQPSKNKSPWASRPKHFMNVTGTEIRLVIMLMISSSDQKLGPKT